MKTKKEKRKKRCKECEEKFNILRLKQKFCSRRCRNTHNNRKIRLSKSQTKTIDNILHQNYRLIQRYEGTRITKNELAKLGFIFQYITHFKVRNGGHVFCLYEYCYYFAKGNYVVISKIQN